MNTISTILLQYPIFIDNIIEYLSLNDMLHLSITQKLFHNKHISTSHIQWWNLSCLETNRENCIIQSVFKKYSYRFAKLNKLYGQVFYPIIKLVCGTESKPINRQMFRSLRILTQTMTNTQNKMNIELNMNLLFEFPLFRSHIIDEISYKDNKYRQIELLWFISNILYSNGISVKKLINHYNIIPNIISNLKYTEDSDLIEMYAWCIGNIMGESLNYYENIRKLNGFEIFFQKIKLIDDENISDVILWVLSIIVKVDKLFFKLKIFQLTVYYFFRFQNSISIRYQVYKIIYFLIKEDKNIFYSIIRNIDLIPFIIQDITHINPKIHNMALRIVASILSHTSCFTKQMYEYGLFNMIKSYLNLNKDNMTFNEEQEIGRLIHNIIVENNHNIVLSLLQKYNYIIHYFITNRHKITCRLELLWIINSICFTHNTQIISFAIKTYNIINILDNSIQKYNKLQFTEIKLCFESFHMLYRLFPILIKKERYSQLFKTIISSKIKDIDIFKNHPFLEK